MKKSKEKAPDINNKDTELIKFLMEIKRTGLEYRNRFRAQWDDCESQIRCVLPESYKNKEDWQTKIFIPQQAKKSEVAQSFLNKMLFGKSHNIELQGIDPDNKELDQNLTSLVVAVRDNGGFQFENKFVVNEGVDIGTSIMKMSLDEKGKLCFKWRTIYNVLLDPMAGQDFDRSRYFVDQYTKDIAYLIDEAKKDKSLYDKEIIKQLLNDAKAEGDKLAGSSNTGGTGNNSTAQFTGGLTNNENMDTKQALMVVKGIDGTNYITMPSKYRTVGLDEYWCEVPNEQGIYEKRIITIVNDKYIIRNEENAFGFIPAQWLRIKKRKYECYGLGYINNTRGLQELMNSIVNIGFDSLKINSMDIVVLDESKVRDPNSIKYKPLAVWKMKDVNGARIQRNPMGSAITDVLRGLGLVDQIDQDASGITKATNGSPELGGSGAQGDTLGEYQLKLQAIDQRFLDECRFIEQDYLLPLTRKIFKIVKNPKLFDQDKVDHILGTKITKTVEVDPNTGKAEERRIRVPLLDIKRIQESDDDQLDFRAVGVTQFTDRLEGQSKLKEIMMQTLSSPVLEAITNVPELWKRTLQSNEIPEYQELLKKEDELNNQFGGTPGAPPQQGMGGAGMPPQPPNVPQQNPMGGM